MSVADKFRLDGKTAVITGGAGLLGRRHAAAIAEYGGVPVILDVDRARAEAVAAEIASEWKVDCVGIAADITRTSDVQQAFEAVVARTGRVDILVNNAANNPKMETLGSSGKQWSRAENYPAEIWERDLAIGLTGSFLCSQVFGAHMAERGGGAILNVLSDLALIGPDQRIYRTPGLPENQQPAKPPSYSAVKGGLLALTRFFATYWAKDGVRVNALSPGGVENGPDPEFVGRLTNLIPLGRMARGDEYQAAVVFLVSEASSYMTGANLVVDGGRTAW
jgi:NAD(P)-dependent dehydrogenase (short-subunit alcohol dehydrogenase family)